MYVPEHLYHDAPNPFTLYGFKYPTIAHFIVVQTQARRALPFKHFFDMKVTELPEIHCVNRAALEEALNAVLPPMEAKKYEYASSHHILGIGTTLFRLKFGAQKTGKNAYGEAITSVLKRRLANI